MPGSYDATAVKNTRFDKQLFCPKEGVVMRRMFLVAGLFCFVFASSSVMAQSLFEECKQKKQDIAEMENQFNQINLDVEELNKKVRELQREKFAKLAEKKRLEKKIKVDKAMTKRMCSSLRQCDNLDKTIERLKNKIAPFSDRLRRIRKEIGERTAEVVRLNRKVDQIETSYAQLNCDNLIPGKAAQSTIDRCTDLFSQWNQLQKDINRIKGSVVALRHRYQKVMKKLKVHSAELARLLVKMRKTCRHSERLADLEEMEKEQHGYRAINEALVDMESKVRKIKKLKINRPKMKPVLRPMNKKKKKKKKRPGLKPVR
jgi:chromosome segregation ATPase